MKNIPTSLLDKQYICVNYVVFENIHGEEEFFYIAVRGNRMPEFKRALREGGFYPDEYGFILEHGKGQATELIKEKMTLQYRCDHSKAIRLNLHSKRQKKDIKRKSERGDESPQR